MQHLIAVTKFPSDVVSNVTLSVKFLATHGQTAAQSLLGLSHTETLHPTH